MAPLNTSWTPPPAVYALAEGEVHIWRALLTRPETQIQRLHDILSPEERDRAARFRFERDRERFIVGHGALREILGSYVGQNPAELRLEESHGGKPVLSGIAGNLLGFNLSHSDDLALIALALRREVGVDVEKIRDVDLTLARRYFAPVEADTLESLPAAERLPAFFTCWTLKEAYMKATGSGLSLPLDSFAVSFAEPPTLLNPSDSSWTLHSLHPAPGYTGALAVDGDVVRIQCWEYQEFG